ncbi:MAG: hypothetical protein COU47_00480 [Candidatus Niyogibacteria bacterium CG10_big_fil_rev_8_21_14_0_10_46_36]|uniref:Phosphoribosylformylglycinamidine synthase subunit PurS n=1 Tax=Candidatus Niyogibacteria bacterium CG10_big_fil_rev_8_21_14_0_10_46_36 TaxID=1974726 RepID=A0A2H0TEC6_9BACT|nr:MAG: hypothetical protein COU47_00480 [Candidatus Niyogibacteria bacterium CG10_big_fil_rev_8_21_14_0_10_46_36]
MAVSMIAAMAKNNVIGHRGKLPWHLPKDMAYFASMTKGHPVIMGRKTFESIGKKPLPQRTNIVITKRDVYAAPGCLVAHSLGEGLFYAQISPHAEEIFIIGGSVVYKEGLRYTERLYITEIDYECEGDAFFPDIDSSWWKEISRIEALPDEENMHRHAYVTYAKLTEKERSVLERAFHVVVEIMPKDSILDPEGAAIMKGLHTLGFTHVNRVRIGKRIQLEMRGTSSASIRKSVESMCQKLLANSIIEYYAIQVM